jgi:hypothetical protein
MIIIKDRQKSAAGVQMTTVCPITPCSRLQHSCMLRLIKIEDSSKIEYPKPRLAGHQRNRKLINVAAESAAKTIYVYKRAVWHAFLIRCWRYYVLVSTDTQDYDAHERFKLSASISVLHLSPTVLRCIYMYLPFLDDGRAA